MRGLPTEYEDASVRLYIQSNHGPLARKPMIPLESRPGLSGYQSEANLDTSLLSHVPSEPPHLGSRPLLLASSDVRFGSEAAPT